MAVILLGVKHSGAKAIIMEHCTALPGFGLQSLSGLDPVLPVGSSTILGRQLHLRRVNF